MEKKRCVPELPHLEEDSNLLGKEERHSEIFKNDHDCDRTGHRFGIRGLCAKEGGSDPGSEQNREVGSNLLGKEAR